MLWKIKDVDERTVSQLARESGLAPPLAAILVQRGIATPDMARVFLYPNISDLHDPFLMDGMEAATERIRLAYERGERVLLFGDYDVDGITSTAAMGKILECLGLRYAFCHPDRFTEGYGFNRSGVRLAKESGSKLIITLDCGTESPDAIAEARNDGIDCIVLDHHIQRGVLPPANAIVNPKKSSCPYPFEGLVSAAIVLKLARALVEKVPLRIPWGELLQLAALATVADVAALREENRVIAILGLDAINRSPLPGISALVRAAGLGDVKIGAGHLAFQLGPRLNAAGRIGTPQLATRLLLEVDDGKCREIARELNRLNSARQSLEKSIVQEAIAQLEEREGAGSRKVIVVAGHNWNRGVVGIVAARLLERYYRPTVVIACSDGMGHGSARSIPEFDLFRGLSQCQDLFSAFGGHTHAAGISLPQETIDLFRERINTVADEVLSEEDLQPKLRVDGIVRLGEIDFDLLRSLEKLEPFGAGNPRPVMAARGVRLIGEPRTIGRAKNHVKLTLGPSGGRGPSFECVGWGMAGRLPQTGNDVFDVAFVPQINEWNHVRRIQLVLKDVHEARS
jgi:single-stranded-DNA-specific exonuclease